MTGRADAVSVAAAQIRELQKDLTVKDCEIEAIKRVRSTKVKLE